MTTVVPKQRRFNISPDRIEDACCKRDNLIRSEDTTCMSEGCMPAQVDCLPYFNWEVVSLPLHQLAVI